MSDALPPAAPPPGDGAPRSDPPPARTPDAALAAAPAAGLDPAVGTQARTFAWLFGAAGIAVLICCGGGLSWANGVEKTDDPDRVRAIAASLLIAEIPDRFTPEQALGVPPPPIVRWFKEGRADLVDYAAPGGGRMILSRQTHDDTDPAVAVAAAAADMLDVNGAPGTVRTVLTEHGRSFPVAFGETPANPAEGPPRPGDPEAPEAVDARPGGGFDPAPASPAGPVRRVFGMFREGSSTYIVELTLPAHEYDPAEVNALLESLAPAVAAPPADRAVE